MASIKRKTAADRIVALEAELAAKVERRRVLFERMTAVESRLQEARAARRRALIDDGDFSSIGSTADLADDVAAHADALAAVDREIADVTSRLAEEREQRHRQAAADDLREHAAAINVAAAAITSAGANLGALVLAVTDRLPGEFAAPASAIVLRHQALVAQVQELITNAECCASAIAAGHMPIRGPQAPVAAPVVIDRGPRMMVVTPYAARWTEPATNAVETSGTWAIADLPAAIAAKALEARWAYLPTDPVIARLRTEGMIAPTHQRLAVADTVVDLDVVPLLPPAAGMFGGGGEGQPVEAAA